MKTSSKYIIGIMVGGLILSSIPLSQTGWANGKFFSSPSANSLLTHTSMKLHNQQSGISTIPITSLSEAEKTALTYQYSEEMVARDLYTYFATRYPDAVFSHIAKSEQQHMDAVKTLLDRYSLPIPTGYGTLQSTFDSLKSAGSTSLQSALEVGLKVEMLDIDDTMKTIKMSDNDDIKLVFANIGGASYNHLRGFSKALKVNGFVFSIDTSKYLSVDEINSRGSLQSKLTETLQANGISLPTKPNTGFGLHQRMSGKQNGNPQNRNGQGKNHMRGYMNK